MKTPSNDLFALISSMSKDEKHFFRKFVSIHAEEANVPKNYLMLFNAIEEQTEGEGNYDEKKIKEEFSGKKFIVQLHVTKIYLEGLILKSLFLKMNDSSSRFRIKKLINDADILFAKGLYMHCSKKLQSAKKLAYQTEFFDFLLQIISLEIDNENRKFNMFKRKEYSNAGLYSEYKKVLSLADNHNSYEEISNKMFAFYLAYIKGQDVTASKEFKELYANPFLKDSGKALSYRAKMMFHLAKSHIYTITREFIKDYKNQKLHLHLMEQNSETGSRRYLSVYNNFLSTLHSLKKFNELNERLDHLKNIKLPEQKKEAVQNSAMQFRMYYLNKILLLTESGNSKELVSEIDKLAEGLRVYSKYISGAFMVNLTYGLSFVYFTADKFSEALFYANKILNDKNAETVQPFYSDTIILSLAIHFELGNKQLLEYSVKPSENRIKKMTGKITKPQKIFLKFLQKYSVTSNNAQERKLLENTLIELKAYNRELKDSSQKIYLQFLEVISWIESKLNNESYCEVLGRKFKKINS